MKKLSLFLIAGVLSLSACKKEEPQPTPVVPTPSTFDVTKTIADFSGGVGVNNGYKVTVANLNASIIGPDCYSQTVQNQVTFTSGNSYPITLTNYSGTTTLYEGTISLDNSGNLTITEGATTSVHLYYKSCSLEPNVLVFQ